MAFWLKRPIVIAALCLSIGGAGATLILGVPLLWTPEAAGWASAIATFAAACIALAVGVLPILFRRSDEERQARLIGKIIVDNLAIQELNALTLISIATMTHGVANYFQNEKVSSLLSQVSAKEPRLLLPHVRVLPPKVADALAQAIAVISATELRQVHSPRLMPGRNCSIRGNSAWCEDVVVDIRELRQLLCKWTEVDFEDLGADALVFAKNLLENAEFDEKLWREAQSASE